MPKFCLLYSSLPIDLSPPEIEEANWLTLDLDIPASLRGPDGDGFDALICMGNSFAHLPDFHGDQREHRCSKRESGEGARGTWDTIKYAITDI